MTIEEKIADVTETFRGIVTEIPEEQICYEELPQNADSPFIVFTKTGTTPQNTLDEGCSGANVILDKVSLQVNVYGDSRAQAVRYAKILRDALVATKPGFSCLMVDQFPDRNSETHLKGEVLLFSCWHNQDISA